MYRRRSQCCPGYFESGDLCVREYPFVLVRDISWVCLRNIQRKGANDGIDRRCRQPADKAAAP